MQRHISKLRQQITTMQPRWLWYSLAVGLAAMIYYYYLLSLYFVDEVYDGNKLREWTLDEQITIRVPVSPTKSFSSIKQFVEKYALCQCVHEIQVVWPSSEEPVPTLEDFTFAHTHSRVSFEIFAPAGNSQLLFPSLPIATEAVMLLHPSVEVSCDDLAFTQTVWRSSKVVPVGYFPRLHEVYRHIPASAALVSNNEVLTVSYLGPWHVWWHQKYSLLLTTALMVHRDALMEMSKSPVVQSILQRAPIRAQCEAVLPSIWYAAVHSTNDTSSGDAGGAAPIWVKVPFKQKKGSNYSQGRSVLTRNLSMSGSSSDSSINGGIAIDSSHVGSDLALSECLTILWKQLHVNFMTYSEHKAIRASTDVFW